MVLKLLRNTPRCRGVASKRKMPCVSRKKTKRSNPLSSPFNFPNRRQPVERRTQRNHKRKGHLWAQNCWWFPSAHFPWLTGDFSLTDSNRAPRKCATAQLPVTLLSFDMFQLYFFKERQLRKKKIMAHPCQLSSLSILDSAETEQFK